MFKFLYARNSYFHLFFFFNSAHPTPIFVPTRYSLVSYQKYEEFRHEIVDCDIGRSKCEHEEMNH